METKNINIAIADDQVLFRKGLVSILEREPDFNFLFEADNGQMLLDFLSSTEILPDIIILDLSMPVLNGVDAMKIIHKNYPGIKVIVLSVYSENRFVTHLLDLGISGYLFKNAEPDEVKSAIRHVLEKELFFNEALKQALIHKVNSKRTKIFIQNNAPSLLSPREIEVLKLICDQKTTTEISEELFISVRTVDGHRNNLIEKTGVKNTAGLVVYAVKNRLIDLNLLVN